MANKTTKTTTKRAAAEQQTRALNAIARAAATHLQITDLLAGLGEYRLPAWRIAKALAAAYRAGLDAA